MCWLSKKVAYIWCQNILKGTICNFSFKMNHLYCLSLSRCGFHKKYLAANQHIRISERSYDIEDCSNDAENSALPSQE